MSKSPEMVKEVERLTEQYLHGILSPADLTQLGQYLSNDDHCARLFRDACQLHIDLETEIRSERAIDRTTDIIERSERCRFTRRNSHWSTPTIRPGARRRSPVVLLSTIACFLLIALVAWRSRNPTVDPTSAETTSRPKASDGNLISVRLANAESRVLPIGEVGTVSIQGPAHFELVGNMRARLHYGRIKVRISDERGHGFVVETPRGQVTDLGTEFGVDVGDDSDTGVVVFEGIVDLALHPEKDRPNPRVERLVQGQGLSLLQAGRTDRIMSIVTGNVSTFQRRGESRPSNEKPIIADVWDNIRSAEFKMFYEIVPSGMREDALAYADRPKHDWNGIDATGMPPYLIGADYVKTFNIDKMRNDVEICVSLASPARLFILLDDRVSPPAWLREAFRDTGDDIGLDCGPFVVDGTPIAFDHDAGAGKSVDVRFSIWERIVKKAGAIRLGPNSGATFNSGMYAVAAIPLAKEVAPGKQGRINASRE
jgi:hypothetical protein